MKYTELTPKYVKELREKNKVETEPEEVVEDTDPKKYPYFKPSFYGYNEQKRAKFFKNEVRKRVNAHWRKMAEEAYYEKYQDDEMKTQRPPTRKTLRRLSKDLLS